MFWNKKLREADKLILEDDRARASERDDPSVIHVRISSREQLFSTYGFSDDALNSELGEYISDKAKEAPIKDEIKIKFHTADDVTAEEAEQTVKNHFRAAYKSTKKEIGRISVISLIMTLLGIVALTALILINHFTDNLYITSIVEIAAWVFIWEAVDYFFLQRPVVKAKCVLIQRIYTATVEVCNDAENK